MPSNHPQSEQPARRTIVAVAIRLTTFAGDALGDTIERPLFECLHGRGLEEERHPCGLESEVGGQDVARRNLGAFGNGDFHIVTAVERDELARGLGASVDGLTGGLDGDVATKGKVHGKECEGFF